jgi:hypothetical protein
MGLERFLRGITAAALFLPAPVFAQSDIEKGVLATVHRVFEGMRTADSAMIRSTFAAGARFASIDARATPVVVKYDSIDGWLGGVANSARRWDEQVYDVQVKVDGNMAQVWAPYTFYLDKAVRHCGINALELLHDGSAWKITQLSDTRRREGCRDVLAK